MASPYAQHPAVTTYRRGLILSPMAGITDKHYRMLCREQGAEVTFTEMVSSEGLYYGSEKTRRFISAGEKDAPFGVQLFGTRPEAMARAAEIVQEASAPDMIDVNMGCPVPKITKSGAGCAMMKNPTNVRDVLRALRRVVNRPLTIKMRAGWSDGNISALEVLRIAEDDGVDAATIHTRTREQYFGGEANWDLYWELREQTSLPLVANGDIKGAATYLAKTARDRSVGVMVARAAIGNPFVFAELRAARDGLPYAPPTDADRARAIWRQAHATVAEEHEGALRRLRKIFLAYGHFFADGKALKPALATVSTLEQLRLLLLPYAPEIGD